MKEIDTLTVSKLRPMSEKPVIPEGILQVFVLVYFDYNGIPGVIGFDGRGWQREEKMYGVGWLYLPFYKPADDHREKINLGGCNGSKFEREIEPPINTTRTNCADEMPPDDEVIITECCDAQIPIDQRYCPKCGYECRIHTRKTEGDKCMHSSDNQHANMQKAREMLDKELAVNIRFPEDNQQFGYFPVDNPDFGFYTQEII